MVWVALGLGSNQAPEENLHSALDELLLRFHDLQLSPVFRSQARDKAGPDYLNMVVGIDTELALPELGAQLKQIEDRHRRDRSVPKPRQVTLDIDILLYGDKRGTFEGVVLPRPDIAEAAWVLWPLARIAPKRRHPVLQRTYADLWESFDRSAQVIAPVAFSWHGRSISQAGGNGRAA